eukprot:TRINITY_DN467_c0_g1_i2.p1 TRINITY_DN467_c0_g1~~TRINITY_DN467_c0_g1_i2.p1  ORF type:complete len:475 (+),score=91.99 TRINITY_DN467_c0_g1_i2:844-2268(+)
MYSQVGVSYHHSFLQFVNDFHHGCSDAMPIAPTIMECTESQSQSESETMKCARFLQPSLLKYREKHISSIFSWHLSRILRSKNPESSIAAIHEFPSLEMTSVDVGIVDMSEERNGVLSMGNLISLVEVKREIKKGDENQLLGYFSHMYDAKGIYGPFLGLLVSPNEIRAYGACVRMGESFRYVCNEDGETGPEPVPIPQILYCQLAQVFSSDLKKTAKLLDVYAKHVCAAQSCDRDTPIFHYPCPLSGKEWTGQEMLGDNVMKFTDESTKMARVCKFYDYCGRSVKESDQRQSNIDIIQSVLGKEYLGNMECHILVEGSAHCLVYDWMDGSHEPKNIFQFRKVCADVQKLHDAGYVHGDVRCANIVFGEGDNDAWLLDFDYSGKENEKRYPRGWNAELVERHEHAKPGYPLNRLHDCHSLGEVYKILFEKGEDDKIVQRLKAGTRVDEIEFPIDDQPSLKQRSELAATGSPTRE